MPKRKTRKKKQKENKEKYMNQFIEYLRKRYLAQIDFDTKFYEKFRKLIENQE